MTNACRSTRIKRFAVAVATTLLLMISYVSSYLSCEWLWGRGVLAPGIYATANLTVYAPLRLYSDSALPGARTLQAASIWYQFRGAGNPLPWSKITQMVDE